jgi:hypothetical protein
MGGGGRLGGGETPPGASGKCCSGGEFGLHDHWYYILEVNRKSKEIPRLCGAALAQFSQAD